jgi:hypothetical protein
MVPGTMEEGTHYHTVSMMWCQAPGAELCTWTHHENRPPDWIGSYIEEFCRRMKNMFILLAVFWKREKGKTGGT